MKKYQIGFVFFLFLFLIFENSTTAQEHRLYLPLIFQDYCGEDLVFSAFGDSITSCYFDSKMENFPSCGYPQRLYNRLTSQFKKNYAFFNNGIGGEITSKGLVRFEETINYPKQYCVNPDHPDRSGDCLYSPNLSNPILDLIIIMEGTDDLDQGTSYDLIEENIRAMVQIARQHGLKVIITTISPVTGANRELDAQRIAEFNPRIWQIGYDYQIPVADIYTAFLNFPNWENILITEDGLHPNDQGFEVMAEAFFQTILSHMSRTGCYLSYY